MLTQLLSSLQHSKAKMDEMEETPDSDLARWKLLGDNIDVECHDAVQRVRDLVSDYNTRPPSGSAAASSLKRPHPGTSLQFDDDDEDDENRCLRSGGGANKRLRLSTSSIHPPSPHSPGQRSTVPTPPPAPSPHTPLPREVANPLTSTSTTTRSPPHHPCTPTPVTLFSDNVPRSPQSPQHPIPPPSISPPPNPQASPPLPSYQPRRRSHFRISHRIYDWVDSQARYCNPPPIPTHPDDPSSYPYPQYQYQDCRPPDDTWQSDPWPLKKKRNHDDDGFYHHWQDENEFTTEDGPSRHPDSYNYNEADPDRSARDYHYRERDEREAGSSRRDASHARYEERRNRTHLDHSQGPWYGDSISQLNHDHPRSTYRVHEHPPYPHPAPDPDPYSSSSHHHQYRDYTSRDRDTSHYRDDGRWSHRDWERTEDPRTRNTSTPYQEYQRYHPDDPYRYSSLHHGEGRRHDLRDRR